MNLNHNQIFYIDNFEMLGEFKSHFAQRKEFNQALKPAYKVEINFDQYLEITYLPGYVNKEQTFYQCPLGIFYIQLNKLKQKENQHEAILSIDLKIFNKDFSKNINKILTLKVNMERPHFPKADFLINTINEYIHSNRPLEQIDFEALYKINQIKPDYSLITKAIDELVIEHYEHSRLKVGEENLFWSETSIKNLPDNRYLKKLILTNYDQQNSKLAGREISFSSGVFKDWARTFPSRKSEAHEIYNEKETLKLHFARIFDEKECKLDMIQLENNL